MLIQDKLREIIAKECAESAPTQVDKAVEAIFKLPFEDISQVLIKWMAENQHPHTMCQIDSTEAVLWEGKQSNPTTVYLVD